MTLWAQRPNRGRQRRASAAKRSPLHAGLGHGSTGLRQDRNLMSDACPGAVALGLEFEPNLEVEPEALGGAEVPREPKSGVSGDAALAEDDLVDTPSGNTNVLGQAVLAETVRLEELGQEDFARMDGCELCHGGHLRVVVDDLDVEGIGGAPDEADAPLIVDADAVLASTIALERLEAISGRNAQVGEGVGRIEDDEFPKRDALKAGGQTTRAATLKERFRVGVAEGADHARE